MKKINAIILAAGKGTRMNAVKPKALQMLGGKTLLAHVLIQAQSLCDKVYVVHGFGGEQIQSQINDNSIVWVKQAQQLGTGHAVTQVMPIIEHDSISLILYADVPLIQPNTLIALLNKAKQTGIALLSVVLEDPTGYGRIIRQDNKIQAIVEQKDANRMQTQIHEVNTGIMALDSALLNKYSKQLTPTQNELYLTDIIKMAVDDGKTVSSVMTKNKFEVAGVNDKIQLAALERTFQYNQARQFMQQGLTIKDPARFDCRGVLTFGKDCEVDVNVVFIGDNVLGDNVQILPNCVIENATIKSGASIGPFARIRPQSAIGENAKIGNFVEVKKSTIGAGSKISHLSYIGDTNIGKKVNIGAGVITCNYDGANKHQTQIKDGAFIGSDTQLIAPITIGKNATIGAGSTLTKDAPDATLTLSRARQISLKNWKPPPRG